MTIILLPNGIVFWFVLSFWVSLLPSVFVIFIMKTQNTKQLRLNWVTLNELPTINIIKIFDIFAQKTAVI
jgi:hypothetical protein